MRSPIACWSNQKLYVTDRYNNRIMIWNDNSLTSYKACDEVLGQVGFQAGLMGQVIQSFICHLTCGQMVKNGNCR